jgi:hypothetical protein
MRYRDKKEADLINIAENNFIDGVMLEDFTNNPTISSTDD